MCGWVCGCGGVYCYHTKKGESMHGLGGDLLMLLKHIRRFPVMLFQYVVCWLPGLHRICVVDSRCFGFGIADFPYIMWFVQQVFVKLVCLNVEKCFADARFGVWHIRWHGKTECHIWPCPINV